MSISGDVEVRGTGIFFVGPQKPQTLDVAAPGTDFLDVFELLNTRFEGVNPLFFLRDVKCPDRRCCEQRGSA